MNNDKRTAGEIELDAMRAALKVTKDATIRAALKARILELRISGAEMRRFRSDISW